MFRPLSVNLGLRYAWSGQSLSSFIGVVAVAGLVLSVAVLLIVTSVMNGFEHELKERVLGVLPHITLRAVEPIRDWRDVLARRSSIQRRRRRAVHRRAGPRCQGGKVCGCYVHRHRSRIARSRIGCTPLPASGSFDALEAGRWGVVLGSAVASRLGAAVGDTVVAVLPEASVSLIGITPRQKRLTVVGIVNTQSELDGRAAYLAVSDASRLFRTGEGMVQGLEVRVSDVFMADNEAGRLIDVVGSDRFYAVSWTRTHGSLYRAIAFQRAVMFLLLSLLVGVAAFNLVSALVMIVNQRRSDVAVLRTMGSGSRTIAAAFLSLGLLIGIGGVGIGIGLGVLGSLLVQDGYAWVERTFSIEPDEPVLRHIPAIASCASAMSSGWVVSRCSCRLRARCIPRCARHRYVRPTFCGMSDTAIACRGVTKAFREGASVLPVLKGVDLDVARGERVGIVGRSGSGKSTLLHILGGLADADEGEVVVAGSNMSALGAGAARSFATVLSGSSISFTICCLSSPRSKTSRCRCCWAPAVDGEGG